MANASSDKKGGGCLRSLARLTVSLAIVAVIVGISAGLLAMRHYQAFEEARVLESGEATTLEIPSNTSWPGVVDLVEREGVVDSGLFFDVWGRRTGLAEEVRAGTLYLEGPLTLDEFGDLLRRGGLAEDLAVTLPEGLTIFEVAARLEEAGVSDYDQALDSLRRTDGYEWLPERAESLEGYLFPDTYRFADGVSIRVVVDRLLERWEEVAGRLFEEYEDEFRHLRREFGFDRHDVVIMASIIERETSVGGERDVISRVFYNRLQRGMLLQTDPTCVYGEDTFDLQPTPAHCRDPDNRYSTYVVEGLPPGPIANPGVASLEAALVPSDDPEAREYLYFVSRNDGSGEHYFSTNYAEHRRAIDRFLRD